MSVAPDDALNKLEDALALANLPDARVQLAALEAAFPRDARVGVLRARVMAGEGDVAGAMARLEKLVAEASSSGARLARGYLGALLVAQRRYEEALPHLDAAMTARHDDPALHHALGVALASTGKFGEAVHHLHAACQAMPASAPSFFYAGICHAEMGDFDAASRALLRCVELAPGHEEGWEALCRVEVSRGHVDGARKLLDEGVRLNKGSTLIRRYQVGLLSELGDSAAALKALESIPAASRNAQDLVNLALLSLARKDRAAALKHAQGAVKADATLDQAHFALGLALEGQEPPNRSEFIKAYQRAVSLGDASGEAGTRLGFVLMESGDPAELRDAVQVLEAAAQRTSAPGTLLNLALAHARSENTARARDLCGVLLKDGAASPSDADQAARLLKVLA